MTEVFLKDTVDYKITLPLTPPQSYSITSKSHIPIITRMQRYRSINPLVIPVKKPGSFYEEFYRERSKLGNRVLCEPRRRPKEAGYLVHNLVLTAMSGIIYSSHAGRSTKRNIRTHTGPIVITGNHSYHTLVTDLPIFSSVRRRGKRGPPAMSCSSKVQGSPKHQLIDRILEQLADVIQTRSAHIKYDGIIAIVRGQN